MRRISIALLTMASIATILQSTARAQTSPAMPASQAAAPNSETAPLDEALHLLRTGKYDAAAEEYKTMIASGANVAEAYAGLARTYLKQKKVPEASAAAAKAVEFGPNVPDAHVALGEVYFRQAKMTEAEHEFIDLIRAGKSNARGFLGMARISAMNSYYAQAKQMIDRAYAMDPADMDVVRERFRIGGAGLQLKIKSDSNADEAKNGEVAAALSQMLNIPGPAAVDPSTRPCRMISHTDSIQVPLTPMLTGPQRMHGYGLNVKLNGNAANLMLDTGASGIVVDRKIAEKAHIKRIVDRTIGGIGDKGDSAGYRGLAESVKVGGLEFQNCYVDVVDRTSVIGDDGLIGADVFAEYLVELDFPNTKLKLWELPARPNDTPPASTAGATGTSDPKFYNRYVAPEMKTYTPVARFGHQLLVRTQLNDGPTRLFLLDTGSMLNAISPAAAKEVTKVSHDDTIQMKGLSGNVKDVFSGDEVTLTFGGLRQRNRDIVAFDTTGLSDSIGTEVSGMLGFAMLRLLDIKIDYRDGLVQFNFDEKRFR